jgi:hypothetical protein
LPFAVRAAGDERKISFPRLPFAFARGPSSLTPRRRREMAMSILRFLSATWRGATGANRASTSETAQDAAILAYLRQP